MKQPTNKRAGFTLVEVIVTLVVLGILAGVGVPAMTGWIDNTRTTTCQANRASLLETYAAYRAMKRISATEADSRFSDFLQEESSLGQERGCPTGGQYALVANAAVTCTKHSLKKGGVDIYVALDTALKTFRASTGNKNRTFDSGAPDEYDNGDSTNRAKLIAAIPALATVLEESGTKGWSVSGNDGSQIFLWTDQDIAALPVNTWVRGYRYNEARSTYTVGYVQIKTNTSSNMGTYHILSTANWVEANKDRDNNPIVQNDETQKTYDGVTDLYDTLMENSVTKPAGKK